MAFQKVTVAPGQQKNGELVEVVTSNEPWANYELSDGSVLKAKLVISEIWRIEGEYDADGNPAYFVKVAPLMNVRSPESLQKKLN